MAGRKCNHLKQFLSVRRIKYRVNLVSIMTICIYRACAKTANELPWNNDVKCSSLCKHLLNSNKLDQYDCSCLCVCVGGGGAEGVSLLTPTKHTALRLI